MSRSPSSPTVAAVAPRGVAADAVADLYLPAGPIRRRAARVPDGLLLVLCLALLLLLRVRADNPLGVRTDSWSEANVLVSARNVATNGWAAYRGAAQHQVDRPPFKSDPFFLYAHYPLGASYLNWALYGLGLHRESALRWPLAACAVATVVLWYLLVCRVASRWTALVSAAVLATARPFLEYADNLFQGYSLPLLVGMMFSFVAATTVVGRRRSLLLGGSWVLLFLNSFSSWEWYLWSQVFYWGYALLLGVPFRKRWLVVFALAPVLAFGMQAYQRRAVLGAEPGASIVDDLLRRTVRLEASADTPRDVTLATYPAHVLRRFQEMYGVGLVPLVVVAVGWAWLFGGVRRRVGDLLPAGRLLLVLFACGLSWWCVMLQHTAVHPHVMRHALFFYALLIGLTLSAGLRLLCATGSAPWVRAVALVAVLLMLGPHTARSYQNIRLHLDRTYVDPNPLDSGWRESRALAGLVRSLPADSILLTNHNRLPLLRYWTQLPVYSGTLSRYPFSRAAPVPGARYRLELTANHLRALYGAGLPRVVYVYFFFRPPDAAYARDRILWWLVDGTFVPVTPERAANFRSLVASGRGRSRGSIVARGERWLAFDATALIADLPPEFEQMPVPTRAEYGPPR